VRIDPAKALGLFSLSRERLAASLHLQHTLAELVRGHVSKGLLLTWALDATPRTRNQPATALELAIVNLRRAIAHRASLSRCAARTEPLGAPSPAPSTITSC
jgi:hypothetical protein